MEKEVKYIRFDDKVIEENTFSSDIILTSEQQICDFINKNNIEVISISCRWVNPTILFYREKELGVGK